MTAPVLALALLGAFLLALADLLPGAAPRVCRCLSAVSFGVALVSVLLHL